MNDEEVLRNKLNLETAQIPWRELERFFAAGNVFAISESLDLVEVALAMTLDDKARIELWLTEGKIVRVSDDEAKSWHDSDSLLWAIVVSPWVLVQEKRAAALLH